MIPSVPAALAASTLPSTSAGCLVRSQEDWFTIWARDHVARTVAGWDIPAAAFTAVPAALVLVLLPAIERLFSRLRARRLEPHPVDKLVCGMLFLAAAYAVLCGVATVSRHHVRTGLAPLFVCYVLITLSEILIEPMGMSLVTKLAPRRMLAMMTGAYFTATAAALVLGGLLGGLWPLWPHSRFFALLVLIALLAARLIAGQAERLKRALTGPRVLPSQDRPHPGP